MKKVKKGKVQEKKVIPGNVNVGNPGGKGDILQTNSIAFTANVAYKVATETLRNLIYDENGELPDDLIGVQFELKKKVENSDPVEWEDLPDIVLSLVSYNHGASSPFTKSPDTATDTIPVENLIDNNLAFPIRKNEAKLGSTILNTWHTLDSTSLPDPGGVFSGSPFMVFPPSGGAIPEAYRLLDFFDEKTGFIYFTIQQIKPLIDYFSDIIISGSVFGLGKKLQRLPENDNAWQYPDIAFTLKIEGGTFIPTVEEMAKSLITVDTSAPTVVLGQPCPPDWYSFQFVLQGIIQQHPNNPEIQSYLLQNYEALRTSWLETVHIGHKSVPYDSNIGL